MVRRTDRIARVAIYDQIKTAFQDLVAPAIHELRGDIRVLDERITALDAKLETKITALDTKLETQITALDAKLDLKVGALDAKLDLKIVALDAKLTEKIGALDAKVTERIDALDAKVTERIEALDVKLDHKISIVEVKLDSFRAETMSMKNELISELRRVDTRIDGVERELRLTLDIRDRLTALEAHRS
jgi:polyhydroxyalkanoate synthesis regulator phasin